MGENCSFIDRPLWNLIDSTKEGKPYFTKKYFTKKGEYEKFFIFISSVKYNECINILGLNKNCVIRFHEIFGKYDFLVKAYQRIDESSIKDLNDRLKKKGIIRNEILYKKVCRQYKYQEDNGFESETIIGKSCKEMNADEFNFINAFITLKKKKRSELEPEQFLTIVSNSAAKQLAPKLIYKVYLLETDMLIFHLNVGCRDIRNLNQFTSHLDKIVDDNDYQKTTYISTNDHINSEAIKTLFSKNEVKTL